MQVIVLIFILIKKYKHINYIFYVKKKKKGINYISLKGKKKIQGVISA